MTDTPPPRRRVRRSPVSCLGLLVLLLLFAFAVAEIGCRIDDWRTGRGEDFYLPQHEFSQGAYVAHPYLGLVPKPGWERTEGYQIHVNALGLRGPETTREKPEGTYRIVCIGGSTTWGTGAHKDEWTYPARLEDLLNHLVEAGRAPAGRRYEVLNGGVSGFNSADSLINLELRLAELKPDAVIDYDAVNDGRITQTRDFQPDYSNVRRPPPIIELPDFERFLLRHCHLYARLTRGTDPEQQLGQMADYVFVPDHDKKTVSSRLWINEYGLSVFGRNLREICAVSRALGAQPLLQTFAVREPDDPNPSGMGPWVVRANQLIRDLGQELDVPVIPTAESLTGQEKLFDDWVHFNDTGELAHARAVADFALTNGLLGLK
jgi:lysophospholipase L1-like esterase